jgi:hypothetical protein
MQEAVCDVLGRREGDNVGTDKNKEYIEIGDMKIQEQRVLNDLYRTRLMVWLHPRRLPPSPVSKLDRRHTGRLRKMNNLLTGEGGRGWGRR